MKYQPRRTIFAAALLLAIAGLGLLAPAARADEASHQAAVQKLFDTMHMKELFESSVTQTVDAQVKQNPMITPYRQILLDFMHKYMDWNSLAPDITKLYMEQFTEPEIEELVKFYSTPIGQKTIKAMPELMARGAIIGQRRVQEHMPELQDAIRAAAAKQAPPPGAAQPPAPGTN